MREGRSGVAWSRSLPAWGERSWLSAWALLFLAACEPALGPPDGQLLLYVDTDAPLPAGPGQPPSVPPALFDRLRIDLVPAGAGEPCEGCSREFGVDAELVRTGQGSIGIVPELGVEGVRARLRLFRSGGTASGEPRPGSTLETVVTLPPVAEVGKTALHVTLWTDQVGRPAATLDEPASAHPGPPAASLVGSWPAAVRVPCAGQAGLDEVCVSGGAFWMGNPRLDLGVAAEIDGELERLVVLSPFFLDRTEVTVAAFRDSGLAVYLTPGGLSNNPHEAGQSIAHCTYTSQPGPFEAHPVNCISWHLAQQYCESLGKRLPTEAELEYAGSALGQGAYVWGADEPRCEDAVHGRSTSGDRCGDFGIGPAVVGSAARDRLALADGEAVDLAGNLVEWAADRWNRETELCWTEPLLFDPLCDTPSPIDGWGRVLRGGHWSDLPWALQASIRSWLAFENNAVAAEAGFRCARPGG